jgi:DNA-binding NarL/FixJ family response regulator
MQTISEDQKARIAQEVAARYGVMCSPEVVQVVPRGVSSFAGYVFEGNQLVPIVKQAHGEAARKAINATWREAARKKRVAAARAKEVVGPVERAKSSAQIAAELRRNQIRNLAAQGQTLAQIAAYMGIKERTLASYCSQHKIEVARPPKKVSSGNPKWKEYTARAIAFISAEPRTITEIAEFMGIRTDAVRRFCRRKGLTYLRTGREKKVTKREASIQRRLERVAEFEARRIKVGEMYDAGKDPITIAADLGWSLSAIRSDLRKLGKCGLQARNEALQKGALIRLEKRQAVARERREKVLEMRKSGMTIPQMARELGASKSAIQRDMIALGLSVQANPAGFIGNPTFMRKVRTMRASKMSIREIAEATNLAKTTVCRMIKAMEAA